MKRLALLASAIVAAFTGCTSPAEPAPHDAVSAARAAQAKAQLEAASATTAAGKPGRLAAN